MGLRAGLDLAMRRKKKILPKNETLINLATNIIFDRILQLTLLQCTLHFLILKKLINKKGDTD